MSQDKHHAECEIHASEACGDDCGATCDRDWHHRPAFVKLEGWGPVCRDCLEDLQSERRGYNPSNAIPSMGGDS